MSSEDKESEILKIIEKLTTTGKRFLDETLMKQLKKICKSSDVYVNSAYYALMTQLRKNHSEMRLSALLAMNELFCRSSAFRKLLEIDLEEFLELVAETDPDSPLPLPQPAAKELKLKGLEFMQNWCTKFGEKYTRLQLALTFLKKCRKVDFNDMEARNAAQREKQRQEEERQLRLMNEKIAKVKSEMQEYTTEIISLQTQMESCFRLLIPHPDEFFSPSDFEISSKHEPESGDITSHDKSGDMAAAEISNDASNSENNLEESVSDLRHHGLYDMKKTITIEIKENTEPKVNATEDTQPIIENLNDLHRQISTKYYPLVSKWLKILTKASNCTDILKKAIDIKQILESSLNKYKELKISPQDSTACDDDDEEDEFEEVKDKEGFEATAKEDFKVSKQSFDQPGCSKDILNTDPAFLWKLKHFEHDVKDPTSAVSTLSKRVQKCKSDVTNVSYSPKNEHRKDKAPNSPKHDSRKDKKAELLEKAPVLPYDIDLYHWEEKKPLVPEVVRFDSLHKFWESKNEEEENEALKEFQIASLRTRKIDFSGKFEPVKWSCRAPMPSGKLCPRKDRYKCPFHGKIVKRDHAGNPVEASGSSESAVESTIQVQTPAVPDWQDPALLRDIEAATGINLEIPQKRKKGEKGKSKKKKKKDGLTDIKNIKNTTRERLSKKIIKRYKHYARKLDDMERKRFNDKFGDQWNYY